MLNAPLVEVTVCVAVSLLRTVTVAPGDTVSDDGVNAKFLTTIVTEVAADVEPPGLDVAAEGADDVDDAGALLECELPHAARRPAAPRRSPRHLARRTRLR